MHIPFPFWYNLPMPTDLDQYDLNFPCEYPVKLFGLDEDDFFEFSYAILEKHIPGISREDLTMRTSHNGKYLAVSTTFTARDRAQVDALYAEIGANKRILFAF